MKTIPDANETANKIDQVLEENTALKAKLAERDDELARLRKHMELQQREMEALQAEQGGKGKSGSREEATAVKNNGAAHSTATDKWQDVRMRARNLGW